MTSNLEQEIEQFKKSLKHQKDSRQAERERRKVTIKQLKQRSKEDQKALMKANRKLAKQELTINKLKTELKNVR